MALNWVEMSQNIIQTCLKATPLEKMAPWAPHSWKRMGHPAILLVYLTIFYNFQNTLHCVFSVKSWFINVEEGSSVRSRGRSFFAAMHGKTFFRALPLKNLLP